MERVPSPAVAQRQSDGLSVPPGAPGAHLAARMGAYSAHGRISMAENGGGHALQCHLALSRNRPEDVHICTFGPFGPVRLMCSHPRGETCVRNSTGISRPALFLGSTQIRGVKRRDRLPFEGRASVRGRRLDVQPSMSATLTPRILVLPTYHDISAVLAASRALLFRCTVVLPFRRLRLWRDGLLLPATPTPCRDGAALTISTTRMGAGLILSTPRMLESVNSGAQRGAGGHVGLIGATLPT